MIEDEDYELIHFGTPRHSGRYPWGSGTDPYQNSLSLLNAVSDLRKQGFTESQIADHLGIHGRDGKASSTRLRALRSIAKNEILAAEQSMATRLRDKGLATRAIAERMGIPEPTVRLRLKGAESLSETRIDSTTRALKEALDRSEYLDIGRGTEQALGVSKQTLDAAATVLKEQGYEEHYIKIRQVGTGLDTSTKVLAPPGTEWTDVNKNKDRIGNVLQYSEDEGASFVKIAPPKSIDSSRVGIRYGEDGGGDADGVMYVRPGVKDVSLGSANYAQVRISVDDSHYIKGMAMYSDDLPKGVDILFNTPKTRAEAPTKLDALKPLKDDEDRPFGAVVRQMHYVDSDGKRKQSVMNIVNAEGDWADWSKSLSSQMLSKQSLGLAKQQLALRKAQKEDALAEISALTNPVVKKRLLQAFADGADVDAVDLKAAALPRQSTNVILPHMDIKPTEIYSPYHRNGERVALVRYPHGGKFEIPELVVNNKTPSVVKAFGSALDAVGIHPSVAERLSGADFDGDTVLVIPNNSGAVKSAPALKGLVGFDPKKVYPGYEGMEVMTPKIKAQQMGKVSNLINDMTIKGATDEEIARAVRHSMVVIDAEKHKLNYKLSADVNAIAALKDKYQGGANKGASTLISRASAEVRVNRTRAARVGAEGGPINPRTGEINRVTDERYQYTKYSATPSATKKMAAERNMDVSDFEKAMRAGRIDDPRVKVETTYRQEKSNQMMQTKDAHTLSSGQPIEKIYADHANDMKALANRARKEMVATPNMVVSPSAKKVYASEVDSLKQKLTQARMNAPLERRAQILANQEISTRLQSNPHLEDEHVKRVKSEAIRKARLTVGADKTTLFITPEEWVAIQSGAVSSTLLSGILESADLDQVKEYATPRDKPTVGTAMLSRARAMINAGASAADVADALGVSPSTLRSALEAKG